MMMMMMIYLPFSFSVLMSPFFGVGDLAGLRRDRGQNDFIVFWAGVSELG